MGPLVRFFGAFGPWVLYYVCVMWIGVVQWGGVERDLWRVCIFHNQKMHVYLIVNYASLVMTNYYELQILRI